MDEGEDHDLESEHNQVRILTTTTWKGIIHVASTNSPTLPYAYTFLFKCNCTMSFWLTLPPVLYRLPQVLRISSYDNPAASPDSLSQFHKTNAHYLAIVRVRSFSPDFWGRFCLV